MTQRSRGGIPMDTPGGRQIVPGPARRLHGGDRSGLGEKGWSEEDGSAVGHPEDTNVPPDYHLPQPKDPAERKL